MEKIYQRKIEKYCRDHSSVLDQLLIKIETDTALYSTTPQMLSGKLVGILLNIILSNQNFKEVLEIGSFTGYSTLAMAIDNPHLSLTSLEVNDDRFTYLQTLKGQNKSKLKNASFIKSDALSWIQQDEKSYDVVFIDANKKQYLKYLKELLPRIKTNGLIITDNVLWYNKVLDKQKNYDTNIIDIYNKLIYLEPRLKSVMLPISDGLLISQLK